MGKRPAGYLSYGDMFKYGFVICLYCREFLRMSEYVAHCRRDHNERMDDCLFCGNCKIKQQKPMVKNAHLKACVAKAKAEAKEWKRLKKVGEKMEKNAERNEGPVIGGEVGDTVVSIFTNVTSQSKLDKLRAQNISVQIPLEMCQNAVKAFCATVVCVTSMVASMSITSWPYL